MADSSLAKTLSKLSRIQSAVKAPKNMYNSFGKYKYRNAESILEALKPLLAKENCSLILGDEILSIGNRFYVKATALLYDNESCGEVKVCAYAREDDTKKGMDGSQLTGTASSYARKYALNGLFLLDDTKDADTDENHVECENRAKGEKPKQEAPKPVEPKTEPPKWKVVEQMAERDSIDIPKLCRIYKVTSLNQLSDKLVENAVSHWAQVRDCCGGKAWN